MAGAGRLDQDFLEIRIFYYKKYYKTKDEASKTLRQMFDEIVE